MDRVERSVPSKMVGHATENQAVSTVRILANTADIGRVPAGPLHLGVA